MKAADKSLKDRKPARPLNAALIVLGCPKNVVEAEFMAGSLKDKGFNIVVSPIDADIIVIHTCSFTQSARKESHLCIQKILKLKKHKKVRVFVSGCLPQLLKDELLKKFPSIDACIGTANLDKVAGIVSNPAFFRDDFSIAGGLNAASHRLLSSNSSAYLKIAEGCDRKCSFCIIPSLRGGYQSQNMEVLIDQAKALADAGIKELIIIAQDTTSYGRDIYGSFVLDKLLLALSKISAFHWIRVLYAYPQNLKDETLEMINAGGKICAYLDMPIQHINRRILAQMKRPVNARKIIERINSKFPNIVLRTSLIAGFPGEKSKEFRELRDFIKEGHFLYSGVFEYSQNEKAPSSKISGQLSPLEIKNRRIELENAQYEAFKDQFDELKNKEFEVLIEERIPKKTGYKVLARASFQAPEIDGHIVLDSPKAIALGTFKTVKIKSHRAYGIKAEFFYEPTK